jgi:O-Antigen ligase
MTALAVDRRAGEGVASRSHAVFLLQVFATTVMVFPSDDVLKAVGAGGYVAALVSYCLFLAWLAATLFGQHNPLEHRSPVRIPLCMLWLVSLASYALMNRGLLTPAELTSGERWLMQLAGVSGVILVASECLRSIEDINRIVRALTWGGAFCGIVAALQFWLKLDITHYLHLPGFTLNQADTANAGIGSRGSVSRVPGTATDPIELGVTAGMLLPLAVYMAMHDIERSTARRWLPVFCIGIAIPASVSRSAFIAAGVALGVLIVSLPPAGRLWGLGGVLFAVVGIFMTAHGLIGTLKSFFLAGTSDPSIAHRVNNYPFVEQLVRDAPWFGQGGGTYIAPDTLHILDNQYLTTAIELGLVGVAALLFFLLWPAIAALVARSRSADPTLRILCAALAGSELAAALCSATFDSLSFPMFVSVQALVVGLIGAAWLLAEKEHKTGPFRERFNGITDGRQHTSTSVVESD